MPHLLTFKFPSVQPSPDCAFLRELESRVSERCLDCASKFTLPTVDAIFGARADVRLSLLSPYMQYGRERREEPARRKGELRKRARG